MAAPLLNITIPVFNRPRLTQEAILSLHKLDRGVPFVVTVVDNGSEPALRARLVEFREAGLIDNLFLLPRNMGISCACNIGWQAVDTPFYMKLDNDMKALRPDCLERLFRLWAYGKPLSTLGPALAKEDMTRNPGTIHTPEGDLGICLTNVPGGAIIIPRAVSEVLGRWNEDYGLYGADDGDYGARMVCAGFPQYYYDMTDTFRHDGAFSSEEYAGTRLDKAREYASLFDAKGGGVGLFVLNCYLFRMCIRSWNVPLRYRIRDVDGYNVILEGNPEYAPVREALRRSKRLVDELKAQRWEGDVYGNEFVLRLKDIWKACGQECRMP